MSRLTYYARKQLELKSQKVVLRVDDPTQAMINDHSIAIYDSLIGSFGKQIVPDFTVPNDTQVDILFSAPLQTNDPLMTSVPNKIILPIGFQGALRVTFHFDTMNGFLYEIEAYLNPGNILAAKMTGASPPFLITGFFNACFAFLPIYFPTKLVAPLELSFKLAVGNFGPGPDPSLSNASLQFLHLCLEP